MNSQKIKKDFGEKIQLFAILLGSVGGLLESQYFLNFLIQYIYYKDSLDFDHYLVSSGMVFLIAAIVTTLIFSFLIYGFGQMITDVRTIRISFSSEKTINNEETNALTDCDDASKTK